MWYWIFCLNCIRLWTLHLRTTSRGFSISRRTEMATGSGLLATWPLVVLLVHRPFCLFTLLTMPVPVLPMMLRLQRRVERDNSKVLLMSTGRHWHLMALLVSTVVLISHVLESSCIVVCILDCTILWNQLSSPDHCRLVFCPYDCYLWYDIQLNLTLASVFS